jgi:phage baseplate assembly protein gpV
MTEAKKIKVDAPFLRESFESESSELGVQEPRKVDGTVRAKVINVVDPLLQGRVQVKFPFICGDVSAWANVVQSIAGMGHGNYFIPNIGDQVLVAFENGDVNSPHIVGSLWNAASFPPLPTPLAQIRTMRMPFGSQFVFSEVASPAGTGPCITIQNGPTVPAAVPSPPSPVGPYQTINLSPTGIKLDGIMITLESGVSSITLGPAFIKLAVSVGFIDLAVGNSSIRISPTGIAIDGPIVSINGTSGIVVTKGG